MNNNMKFLHKYTLIWLLILTISSFTVSVDRATLILLLSFTAVWTLLGNISIRNVSRKKQPYLLIYVFVVITVILFMSLLLGSMHYAGKWAGFVGPCLIFFWFGVVMGTYAWMDTKMEDTEKLLPAWISRIIFSVFLLFALLYAKANWDIISNKLGLYELRLLG